MSTTENIGGALAPTKERMNTLSIAESFIPDIPAYESAMTKLVKAIPGVVTLDKKTRAAKYAIGFLILDVRQTFRLANGEPDTFGTSDAYKKVYGDSIVQKVLASSKTVEESEVRSLLKDVQENYMRDNDKRKGMGLAYQQVLLDAVAAGKIPDATATPTDDGRLAIEIRPTVEKDGERVPVLETVSTTVVNDDGTETVKTEEVPKVTRYVTGGPDAPDSVRKIIKTAVAKRGRKDQKVPQWAGGPEPEKSKPGPKSDNPVAMTETYHAAWIAQTENLSAVAFQAAMEYATAGLTTIVDQVLASKGEGFNAKTLGATFARHGALATAMGRYLANNDDAKTEDLLSKVTDLRYVPETVTTPEPEQVPEPEHDNDNDDDDAKAADKAAKDAETV